MRPRVTPSVKNKGNFFPTTIPPGCTCVFVWKSGRKITHSLTHTLSHSANKTFDKKKPVGAEKLTRRRRRQPSVNRREENRREKWKLFFFRCFSSLAAPHCFILSEHDLCVTKRRKVATHAVRVTFWREQITASFEGLIFLLRENDNKLNYFGDATRSNKNRSSEQSFVTRWV